MENIVLPIPRNLYSDLNESEYSRLFKLNHSTGGALSDIAVYEKKYFSNIFNNKKKSGAGIFSFLSGLAKKSLPYISKYILPEAVNFTSNLINEKIQNKKIDKKSLKRISKDSFKNIARKALLESGGGKNLKRFYKDSFNKIAKKTNKRLIIKKKKTISQRKKRKNIKKKKKITRKKSRTNLKKNNNKKKSKIKHSIFDNI